MIPRVLNQTWKTKDIPSQWTGSYNSCQTVLASYEKKLWTDDEMEQFVKTNYPEIYDTYMGYTYHIQRCDAFRYMLMYKNGGIYFDLDIACKASIEPLLNNDIVLARSTNVESYLTNSIIMAVPGHPFFRYVIDKLPQYKDKYSMLGKHLHVMNSTGPMFITEMYNQYVKENGEIPRMYIMSKEEFAGDCNVCSTDRCAGGKYFTHVTGKSWNSWDSTLYNAIMCNYIWIIVFIMLAVVIYMYVRKRSPKSRYRR